MHYPMTFSRQTGLTHLFARVSILCSLAILGSGCGGDSDSVSQARSGQNSSEFSEKTPDAIGSEAPSEGSSAEEISWRFQPTGFAEVPMQYRPKFRWWWPSDQVDVDELHAELDAMYNAGFGGVELSLLRNPTHYGTAAYREKVKATLIHANELGMTVDMTLGAAWPISSPSINDASKNLASQDLVYGALDVIGPAKIHAIVPKPVDSGLLNQRLIAVTAGKLAFPFQPPDPNLTKSEASKQATPPVQLDPTAMVDLTENVNDAGIVQWEVPEGQWRVFGFWSRETAQHTHGGPASLLVGLFQANTKFDLGIFDPIYKIVGDKAIDHFGREAMETALSDFDAQLFSDDMAPLWTQNGGYIFEDSLEINHNEGNTSNPLNDHCLCYARFWTPEFLNEFKQRRGYDLTPLLPAIFSSYDFNNADAERVRRDYFETLTDLFIANNLRPMSEWANQRGLKSRAQGYGVSSFDTTRTAAGAQSPDTESLLFGDSGTAVQPGSETSFDVLDKYRLTVSGAHMSGATTVSLEAGASELRGGASTPEDYKLIADRAFASGVTTLVIHGFAYRFYDDPIITHSVWPGWDPWGTLFAEGWNQTYPQMKTWPSLTAYMGRAGYVLQQGKPAVDVIVLTDNVLSSTHIGGSDTESSEDIQHAELRGALQPYGYSWDVSGDASFGSFPDVVNKRLLPDGPAYKAVVVDHLTKMSEQAASRLLTFANAGLPVIIIGDLPTRGISYRDPTGEDERVRNYFNNLVSLSNVLRIDSTGDLTAALTALGATSALHTETATGLVAQQRRMPEGDFWFIYNNGAAAVDTSVSLASRGKPYAVELWTGAVSPLGQYVTAGDRTSVPVKLQAGEAMVVSFNANSGSSLHVVSTDAEEARYTPEGLVLRDSTAGEKTATLNDSTEYSVTLPTLPAPMELTGPWKLVAHTIDLDGDATVETTLNPLTDWRDIASLHRSAGTGIYTYSLDVPEEWIKSGCGALLDLGEVGGIAEVFINGKRAALSSVAGRPVDITALLHAGTNEVRIEVSTTLINRLIGRFWEGDGRYFLYSVRKTQAYGLMGPVTLIPYAEALIPKSKG